MKKLSISILTLSFLIIFCDSCGANPLSRILSFFQSDLVINVRYNSPGNLAQGSQVYLADAPDEKGVLIGEVIKVSTSTAPATAKIEVQIGKEYKKQLSTDTPFVLMSTLFSTRSNAYIVAIASDSASSGTPLKSGDTVNGVTFLEYQMAAASKQFKTVINDLLNQKSDMLKQLEDYLNTLNIASFQNTINELIGDISKFSAEQKDAFKKEVLPKLREMVDSLRKQLEEQNTPEKSKELEQQLQHVENLIEI